ncbi:MAG: GLPGLI family protein [Bacteroidota bacterium]
MKKLAILCLLMLPLLVLGQQKAEGEIIYEQLIKIEFDASKLPEGMQDVAKMIPKEQRFKKQLIFTDEAMLFQHFEDPNAEVEELEGPGRGMRMRMERAGEKTFVDMKNEEFVRKTEFFGREFLIKDATKKMAWKMTGEQKEIGEYMVMKATTIRDSQEVVAWFCPTILASVGPRGMGGLPGAILELSMQDGKVTWTADDIQFRSVAKSELKAPKGGKEVTREEFEKIRDEKIAEMQEQWGGKGPMGPRGKGGRRTMWIQN